MAFTSRNRCGVQAASLARVLSAVLAVGLAGCETILDPELGIVLPQRSVDFRAVRGSSTPVSQSIEISNTGGGRLGAVTCPPTPATWLTCSVTGGSLVTLVANPAGLTQSPQPATVELTAPGASTPASLLVGFRIEQPAVTLSSGTLAFTATEGGTASSPNQATLSVSNGGAGSLADLGTISCVPTPATARVTCQVNQSSGGLVVSVDPNGLAPGVYVYPVVVSAANSGGSASFAATLTVGALPRIALSQRSLHFQAVRGSQIPLTQTVTVTNSGGGTLGALTCSSPVSWVTCTVSGTTLTFTANPSGLTTSPAPATVNVSAAGGANNPQTVSVTMALEQPALALSSATVTFTAAVGESDYDPTSASVQVLNTGAGSLLNLGTITCVPPAGSPVRCSVNQGTLVFTLEPTQLVSGVNVYPVTVTAQHSSTTATVAVTVNVTPGPRIGLAQSAVHFTAIRGSTTPISQTVGVVNLGGGTLGVVTCPALPAAWLTCAADQSQITLTANATGLNAAPPPVVVTVTAADSLGANQSAATVTVSMSLDQPVLSVNPTNLQMTGAATQTVQVSNIGAGVLANLGVIACSSPANVTCTPNQGTGQLQITTAVGALTPGTYIRVVDVSATNATNTQTVTIVLTIP
jgi:hypothetical protein